MRSSPHGALFWMPLCAVNVSVAEVVEFDFSGGSSSCTMQLASMTATLVLSASELSVDSSRFLAPTALIVVENVKGTSMILLDVPRTSGLDKRSALKISAGVSASLAWEGLFSASTSACLDSRITWPS
eukprot:7386981-Prymnesium_polylepis.2